MCIYVTTETNPPYKSFNMLLNLPLKAVYSKTAVIQLIW